MRIRYLLAFACLLTMGQSAISAPNGTYSQVSQLRNVYSSTNVTTSAWVQLVASMPGEVNNIDVFDSSGQTLILGTGAVGAEVQQFIIVPGGNGRGDVTIHKGDRLSIKALSGTANTGELDINFYN